MRKFSYFFTILFFASFCTTVTIGQNVVISGNIRNSVSKESLPAVSITIKETSIGTYSNGKGVFKLSIELEKVPDPLSTSISISPARVGASSKSETVLFVIPSNIRSSASSSGVNDIF